MKSKKLLLGILAITLVLGMTAIGCDNTPTDNNGNDPQTAIFQGIAAGYKYVLTITENKSRAAYAPQKKDSYALRITKTGEADKVSTGEVSDVSTDGNTLTLQPKTANSPTFRVKKSGQNITEASDPITLDDGTTVTAGSFEESGEPSTPDATFTTIAEMATWLAAKPANTAATAYAVKLNIADLTGIGNVLYTNNTKYISLDLSSSTFTSIPDNVFCDLESENYNSTLVSVIIPNSVTSIGEWAFANCSSLTSVTIGNKVTSIGDFAFYSCNSLTSVTIPNSVTSIGNQAFCYTGITSITIPSNVTRIGTGTFTDCTSLTSVKFEGTIIEANLGSIYIEPFDGDLKTKYLAGGAGTYTRSGSGTTASPYVWTKQN